MMRVFHYNVMISRKIEKLFDNVRAPYLFSRGKERNEPSLNVAF